MLLLTCRSTMLPSNKPLITEAAAMLSTAKRLTLTQRIRRDKARREALAIVAVVCGTLTLLALVGPVLAVGAATLAGIR